MKNKSLTIMAATNHMVDAIEAVYTSFLIFVAGLLNRPDLMFILLFVGLIYASLSDNDNTELFIKEKPFFFDIDLLKLNSSQLYSTAQYMYNITLMEGLCL